MGDIFLKLLNMSITAGWMILAVLLLRIIFKKMPKWMNCMLWGIVSIRLICPFSIESPVSLVPSAETLQTSVIVEGNIRNDIPSIDSDLSIIENTINPILRDSFSYDEAASVSPLQVVTYMAGIVWCIGMILMVLYAISSSSKLCYMVREAVYYKENIYLCDAVKAPFILGVIRPHIYLPSGLSAEEMRYIVAHEMAHLRRRDHWWKPLGYLLLSVYWFQPLCWVAYILLRKDIELACDEKVIRNLTFSEKKEYSRVLVACGQQRKMVMVCPLAFGEVGVKERVKAVLNYKRPTFWILITAMLICVIVVACFLTNPPKEYQIRVNIPAGSTEEFVYSDEVILTKGNTITLYTGEGFGDATIALLPVEVRGKIAYEPTYITPGMPVKMDVEKGAWYKIGVNMQNLSEENIDVYVSVSNVDVRIASTEGTGEEVNTQEEATQEAILSGMMVANIWTDSNMVAVSKEDADEIQNCIASRNWQDFSSDCLNNCELIFDGQTILYHSECGTFNDVEQQKCLWLSGEQQVLVNGILEKYIDMSDETTIRPDASQNPYEKILDAYYQALYERQTWNKHYDQYCTERNLLYSIVNPYWSWEYGNHVNILSEEGFAILDLDDDGVEELLLGWTGNEFWNMDDGYVFAVYTIVNGEAVLAIEGWEKNLFVIGKDGYLYREGISNVSEGSTIKYKFNPGYENFLEPIEGFYSYMGSSGEICEKFITDPASINSVEDVINYDADIMDKEKAWAIENSWMASGMKLDYTLFSEYQGLK